MRLRSNCKAPIRFLALGLSLALGPMANVSAQERPEPGSTLRMPDGVIWMTRNLDVRTAESYCYDDAEANCRRFGRLYTWQAARLACTAYGKEWRLPTDAEWRRLAKHYGGVSADAADKGRAAYQALHSNGDAGFHAVLGGGRTQNGEYARGDAHGFYWTATEIDAGNAWFYNFGKGGLALHRQDGGEKPRAFSVRCVKEP